MTAITRKWTRCWRGTWHDEAGLLLDAHGMLVRQMLIQHVGEVDEEGTGWVIASRIPYSTRRIGLMCRLSEAQTGIALAQLIEAGIAVCIDGRWGVRRWLQSQMNTTRSSEYLARRLTAGEGAPMWVYFIQAGVAGPIKIGVSNSPAIRLTELQTGTPFELRLLLQRPGTADDERALHAQLAAHRIRGEWFDPSAEVLAEVARG